MIVRVVRYALLFLLPFIAYGIWLLLARRRLRGHENEPGWRDAPLVWLTASGLALVIGGFVVAGFYDGSDAGCRYVPSQLVDGRVVPADMVCDPPAAP